MSYNILKATMNGLMNYTGKCPTFVISCIFYVVFLFIDKSYFYIIIKRAVYFVTVYACIP